MSTRGRYDVVEIMEGISRPESVSVADFCCEKHALQAIERAWGVRLVVGLALNPKPNTWNGICILVSCEHPIHASELNDFPGVILEALDPELASWSLQFVSALYVGACAIDHHMRLQP